jgi:hypothetical protein
VACQKRQSNNSIGTPAISLTSSANARVNASTLILRHGHGLTTSCLIRESQKSSETLVPFQTFSEAVMMSSMDAMVLEMQYLRSSPSIGPARSNSS